MALDFLAIGDTVVDEFIELEDATVHCDEKGENCTISMRWGDKIPFKSATLVAGVGNAANAAVSASRLGLKSGLVANMGKDKYGDDIMSVFKKEHLNTSFITRQRNVPTNHHYVLSYQSERTILVKHEAYAYHFPQNLPPPKTVYLSSLAASAESYHDEIADYLEHHPGIFFVFQPGTFQMKLGAERLKRIYKRAQMLFVNKEEAGRILGTPDVIDVKTLAENLRALGPKTVIITDGRAGAYALENDTLVHVDMYPDPKPPVNRTGAGDAFASTTTSYLTLGMTLKEAMFRGTINSAYVVQGVGAQKGLLTKDVLERFTH
ncbi:MAG: carbohydrate kinase family protein [Patescibacteria group bacterium]